MTPSPKLAAEGAATSLPDLFQRYRPGIAQAMRDELAQDSVDLYDMLRYYMGWVDERGRPRPAMEGKGLRPTLCMFACEAVGGNAELALPAAVALEFIHNFSLIHDDIQDLDETRHGRKTLWAVWGMPKALVAGNALRIVADQVLHKLVAGGLEHKRALVAVGLLTEAYLEMIEGQYLDLSFEGRHDIGMDDYLGMISRKTGALIRCSLALGAVIGADDPTVATAFRNCGAALGYVFQIRDDILGVWGDEETTGKPVGADIRRKKNSYPVVFAMEQSKGQDSETLNRIYRTEHVDEPDVASVLEIMERVDVRGHAHESAAAYADVALESLRSVEMSPQAREEIEGLTQFLLVRAR